MLTYVRKFIYIYTENVKSHIHTQRGKITISEIRNPSNTHTHTHTRTRTHTHTHTQRIKYQKYVKSKVGDRSQEQPEGSLFNSYYTKV